MSVIQLALLFSIVSVTIAASAQLQSGSAACDPNTGIGCLPSPKDCPEGCTCNSTDVEVDTTETETLKRPGERVQFKFVKTVTKYDSAGVSAKLNEKVEHVFRGILVSASLFIACACLCVVSVCVFCCHIRKSDGKLKQEVDALAKKLKIDVNKTAAPSIRQPLDPKEESCNVIVEDANVLCV